MCVWWVLSVFKYSFPKKSIQLLYLLQHLLCFFVFLFWRGYSKFSFGSQESFEEVLLSDWSETLQRYLQNLNSSNLLTLFLDSCFYWSVRWFTVQLYWLLHVQQTWITFHFMSLDIVLLIARVAANMCR